MNQDEQTNKTSKDSRSARNNKRGPECHVWRTSSFVTVNYKPLFFTNLSSTAKAFWVFGHAHPADWTFYFSEMVTHFKEGERTLYRAFNELVKARLACRLPYKIKSPNSNKWVYGGVKYIFFEEQLSDSQINEMREELQKMFENGTFVHLQTSRLQNGRLLDKNKTSKERTKEYAPSCDDAPKPPPPSLSDPTKKKKSSTPPMPKVVRHERSADQPSQLEFYAHFKAPLVSTSDAEHQKLVATHGEERTTQAYQRLAEWKLSKAATEPQAVTKHTDYYRIRKWVMKEVLNSVPGGDRNYQRRGKLAISADQRALDEEHEYTYANITDPEEIKRVNEAWEKMCKQAQERKDKLEKEGRSF